jgi:hypothetical protein
MKNLYKYLRDKLGRDLTEAEMKEAREAVRRDQDEERERFENFTKLIDEVNHLIEST